MNRKRSLAWKHFTKINSFSARCKNCLKVLQHRGNTTNLLQHLKTKHPIPSQLLDQRNDSENSGDEDITKSGSKAENDKRNKFVTSSIKQTDQESQNTSKEEQKSLQKCVNKIYSYKSGGELNNRITNSILHMISVDYLPISIVENEGFRRLMKVSAPLYQLPHRKTSSRMFADKYHFFKEKLKNDLRNIKNICITTDIWTDLSTKSYLGVTMHYLKDNDTKLTTAIADVIPLSDRHTGINLKGHLSDLFNEYEIDTNNINAIVTDNAVNIVLAAQEAVGTSKHIRCCAHLLALVYPNVINKSSEISALLSKVKRIVTLSRTSVVIADELRKLQSQDGKSEGTILKLKQECPTRWNSSFYMIERFLKLQSYINNALLKYDKINPEDLITREELNILTEIVDIFRPLQMVTKDLSGEDHGTSSIVIPLIRIMIIAIEGTIPVISVVTTFKEKIVEEIRQRFGQVEFNCILTIATLLDPRFKKVHFEHAVAVSKTIGYVDKMLRLQQSQTPAESDCNINSGRESKNDFQDLWSIHNKIVSKIKTRVDTSGAIDVELQQYLNQSVVSTEHDGVKNVNPLILWENLKLTYPRLYCIAIKYLSTVATSVPAERLFF